MTFLSRSIRRPLWLRPWLGALLLLLACIPTSRVPQVAPTRSLELDADAAAGRSEPFGVTFTGAQGQVSVHAQLNLVFNRPLRELGPAETEGTPPIQLTPAIEGNWRWVGTNALIFAPRAGRLPFATRIEVSVPQGLRALDGSELGEAVRFELETPRPQVVRSMPYDGRRDLEPNTQFELFFNQPVETQELQRAAQLILVDSKGGRKKHPFSVSSPDPQSPKRAILVPRSPLPSAHVVELVLDESLRGQEGALPAGEQKILRFETYGPLEVRQVHCPHGPSDQACAAGESFSLELSNPVRLAQAKRALTIEPEIPITWESWQQDDELSSYLYVNAPLAAGQTYTLRLRAGLRDAYGQTLQSDYVHRLKVDDHWPRLEVGVRGDSFEPSARTHIPVASINVPAYTLLAAPLSPEQLVAFYGEDHHNRGFDYLLTQSQLRPKRVSAGPKNKVFVEHVDARTLLSDRGGRGALVLAARPSGQKNLQDSVHILQVTDLAITAKLSRRSSLVWVTHLSDARPVSDAEVQVLRAGASPSAVIRTDAQGFASLPAGALGPDPQEQGHQTLLVARKGDDWAYRRVSDYLPTWRFDVPVDVFGKAQRYGFLFTERGIYRPGDTVQVKGILRQEAETGNDVFAGKRVTLVMRSPDWEAVEEWPITTNSFGTFAQTIRVPPTAALGSWRLEVKELNHERDTSTSFEVAEYRPMEIQAKVSSAEPSYVRGARSSFEVHGDYLYGAPMAGAPVTYWATRRETSWHVPDLDAFTTDAERYDAAYPDKAPGAGVIDQGEGQLDPQGKFIRQLSLDLPGQLGTELVSFDAEVADISRQTVASSSSVIVHPADVYVGIENPKSYFLEEKSRLEPRVLVTTPQGQRQTGRSVKLELVRRRWTVARVKQGADYHSEVRVIDEVVSTCTVQSARDPKGCALAAKEAGYYLVLATTRDTRGRTARAAIDLYVLGSGQSYWRDEDTHRVELVTDKQQYRVGDTAKVLIKSPFPEAQALVTVESDGVQQRRRVDVKGATPTIEIPIDEKMRPNAYVSVHLIRPRSAPPPAPGSPDVGAPTYRVGVAELRVDAEARRLHVSLTPSSKELRPGERIDVDVAVKDATGKPTVGEVTLYAVDEGVLSLINYRTPDPLPIFTAPRPLRVATVETRRSLGRVVTDVAQMLGLLGGDKGGDGGGGGESGGVRRDFRQSAYFNPTLTTDANGRARVSFQLPESLTTYRLMAVVTTRDDRYGYAEDRVVTSQRLMARPALPRLLRAGDRAEAGIIVSAKNFGPAQVQVRLEANGIDVEGATERTVQLPHNGSTEVRFPLLAREAGSARLKFIVAGGGERDAVEVERPIASPASLEAVALSGQTTSAAAEALGDLSAIRRDVGGLEVKAASTALVGIDAGIEQLIEFPYACTEQLSSRLLPLLPLRSLAQDFGAALPRNIDRDIEKTAADILSRQRSDGGFAMWPESAESSPWVSAYATWTLYEASQRKVSIPRPALKQATEYLRRQLERKSSHYWHAEAPFLLDVLAQLGRPDPGYMNQLFEQRQNLPLFARAFLLHAMAISKQPAADVTTLSRELETSLRIEGNRAFVADNVGDEYAALMDSPARTTALVLRGLLAARPDHPLGSRLARGLLTARQGGTWRSTQETAFALLALDAYRSAQESTPPNFVARLWFGEKQLAEYTFKGRSATAQQDLIPTSRLTPGNLVFEKEGPGTLFYEARLRYARRTLPTASLDRGFFIQKTFRPVTPAELSQALEAIPSEGSTQAPAGSLVLADLLLVTPSPRDYVVLDDPLPAGLEAVDARLATTASWANISGSTSNEWDESFEDDVAHGRALLPSHYRRELRDDRVLFFADHLAAGIYHFRYLARATTPGRFVTPPTKAEEMYTPEVFGRTAAGLFEVK